MNIATPQLTHARPQSATPRTIAPRQQGFASPEHPTSGERIDETAPIIDVPAFYGPPIIFVLGPWLLLVLLLIGPFALVFTLLLALAAAAGLLAMIGAVIASPYLLIRHLHTHDIAHSKRRAPLHLFRNARVNSGPLGSLQPKGVS